MYIPRDITLTQCLERTLILARNAGWDNPDEKEYGIFLKLAEAYTSCDGNDISLCLACDGTGKQACLECYGHGDYDYWSGNPAHANERLLCPACRGDGTRDCPECGGTKIIEH